MTNGASGFRVTPQVILGLLIVLFGLSLTADNLGWIEADRLWRYWPLIIIGFGLAKVAQGGSRSSQLFGGVLMLVGAAFAADTLLAVEVDLWQFFPLVFVIMGLVILIRAMRPATPRPIDPGIIPSLPGRPETAVRTDSEISEFAFWSGSNRRIASSAFRRADLTAIMGGIELDLRPASTATGEAVIDVFVWWGGIDITVPPDWAVSNQVVAVMGAAEDLSSGTQDARHRLVVRGFVVMGGVEIKTK
jgi:predicted membrane protein